MIGFEIKIVFEPAGPGNGRKCNNCEKEIWDEIYQGIIQFGEADRLDMAALKIYLCASCNGTKTDTKNSG